LILCRSLPIPIYLTSKIARLAEARNNGAMTLSITTFSITALSSKKLYVTSRLSAVCIHDTQHNKALPLC
jgi:hypothetical protein